MSRVAAEGLREEHSPFLHRSRSEAPAGTAKSSRSVQSAPRICVVILGMHRSGAGAFARVLAHLGCDLADSVQQVQGNEEPVTRDAIADLNDRILASAGSRWDDWLEFNPGWMQSPRAEEFREEALALVGEEFGASRLYVLADPRICRLLPFWLAVLKDAGAKPLILAPVDNPLEVAASLAAHDGIEAGLGHLLWLRHVLDGEFASRGTARFFTSYDRLADGWARVATDAETVLGVSWPRMSDKVAAEVEAFLADHGSGRQQPGRSALDNPTLSDWLREAFAILSRWSAEGEDPKDFGGLDRIRTALNPAAPAFARLLVAEQGKARRLESELETERQRLGEREQQIAELKTELQSLVRAAEQALPETQAKLAAAEETARIAAQELAETRSKLSTAERAARAAEQLLGEARSKADAAVQAHDDMRHRLAQTESALAQRRHELDETTAELAAARAEVRQTADALATAERVSAGLKEHLVLLLADVRERQSRAAEQAEADKAFATVTKQVKQVLAVLETSRQHLVARLSDSEQARAAQSAELQQCLDEIAALRLRLDQKQSEADHERAQAERLRQLATTEVGRAAGLLDNHGSGVRWKSFRLKRQIARLKRSGLFDADWYLRYYTDVAEAGIDPLRHYVEFGAKEGRAPNPALKVQPSKG
jgi:hypothetical protein